MHSLLSPASHLYPGAPSSCIDKLDHPASRASQSIDHYTHQQNIGRIMNQKSKPINSKSSHQMNNQSLPHQTLNHHQLQTHQNHPRISHGIFKFQHQPQSIQQHLSRHPNCHLFRPTVQKSYHPSSNTFRSASASTTSPLSIFATSLLPHLSVPISS